MNPPSLLETAQAKGLITNPQRFQQVLDFSQQSHHGQIRYTGDPYFHHPLSVATILSEWQLPQVVLEAALLHDTPEVSKVSLEQIRSQFGDEVAFLVEGADKVGQVKLRGSTSNDFIENMRKMFVAFAQDIRVVLIRLADRLHNMQTIDAIPISKQKRIALETLEIYAPLAERLGMGQLKGTLEDLSFPYAFPQEYQWVSTIASPHFARAEELTKKAIKILKKELSLIDLDVEVHGRHKHRYSLYKKLLRPEINKDISQVHDLIALRIITNDKTDCYASLGIVHNIWKPVPFIGISDFIAQPKPNGYQSIHTKVFDSSGRIMEVQIRSRQMHQQAELGAAAHYAYSEAKTQGVSSDKLQKGIAFKISQKMDWIKQLAGWQHQVSSKKEFATSLKLDALSSRIYVFSPLGDVYDLPNMATPVDFAYNVHTDLGSYIQGAKVNGKLVSLNYKLKSGDLVEIIKSKNAKKPSRDWLRFIKTAKARAKINQALNL